MLSEPVTSPGGFIPFMVRRRLWFKAYLDSHLINISQFIYKAAGSGGGVQMCN